MCSEQTEHGREHTHREMMQTVHEMKKRLPSEKRMRSKASTVEALNYALNCVKQVQGNKHENQSSRIVYLVSFRISFSHPCTIKTMF